MSAPRGTWARTAARVVLIAEGGLIASVLYLLGLLVAAASGRRTGAGPLQPEAHGVMRFLVLVPAHNEEAGIGVALSSVQAIEYPDELVSVVVIADNCTDDTAARAVAAGAEVMTRIDTQRRGKGYAVGWALQRLLERQTEFDAVVMIDADCTVSPNLLAAIERRFRAGGTALQVAYTVANPMASNETALRYAAFSLINVVRPLGKERLGLSCGLNGTGMAFKREVLRRHPWSAASLAEDREYHMRLVEGGDRVAFVPEAWVSSPMPLSRKATAQQRGRWEGGRVDLIRRWTPRLIRSGLAHGDVIRLHAGLEELVPPQSLLAAGSFGCALLAAQLKSRSMALLAGLALAGQVTFVLGGLALVRAPLRVYQALCAAPALIVRQVWLYASLLVGRGPDSWIRTARETAAPSRNEALSG